MNIEFISRGMIPRCSMVGLKQVVITTFQFNSSELNLRQSEEVLVIGLKAGNLWLPVSQTE